MSRPIWNGNISFGLVNIPVTLYSAEKPYELHFHLLDKNNKARIHYERINAETGKKVDWNDIVKAYEFEKGNFILVDEKELENDQADNYKIVNISDFVDKNSIDIPYFDKPYYLVPTKQGEKGYHLLLETLERMKKVGIAKVVIKTKQHLAVLLPYKNVLLLNLLRFHGELREPAEFYQSQDKSTKSTQKYKISKNEINMAERLVENMSSKWNPSKYHDESHDMLKKWIDRKIAKGRSVTPPMEEKQKRPKATVIDFMELLKKSIQEKERKEKEKGKRQVVSLQIRRKESAKPTKLSKHSKVSKLSKLPKISKLPKVSKISKLPKVSKISKLSKISKPPQPKKPRSSGSGSNRNHRKKKTR